MRAKTKVLLVLFWISVIAVSAMFVRVCDLLERKQRAKLNRVEFEVGLEKQLKEIDNHVDSIVRCDRRAIDSMYEREREDFYKWLRKQ